MDHAKLEEDIENGIKKPLENGRIEDLMHFFLFDMFLLLSFKIPIKQFLPQQFLKGWLHTAANAILKTCWTSIAKQE